MERKIARDKGILFYYYVSQMQKKQFVMKGLFFGLFGIVAFAGSVFAQSAPGEWVQLTPLVGKPVGVTVTAPSTSMPSLTIPSTACSKKADEDMKNAVLWQIECKKKNSVTACNKQYDEQKAMIVDTQIACTAAAACTACKTNFCAKETVSCDMAKTAAACQSECGTKGTAGTAGSSMWITINSTCLKNWQCGFNIYEFLWFEGKSNDPTVFVQDILLSASFFIGTVITIALIYSGFLFVTAGISGNSKNADSAKNWIKYSIIGLLIVICSYSLIRLVQYIAKGL